MKKAIFILGFLALAITSPFNAQSDSIDLIESDSTEELVESQDSNAVEEITEPAVEEIIEDKNEPIIEEVVEEQTTELAEDSNYTVYEDDYAGAIKFLKSPITENFLVDIKDQLRVEFEKSFRNLKEYDALEKEIESSKTKYSSKDDKDTSSNLKGAVLERLSTMFLPEFLNRLDDIIVFQPLKPEELRKICDIMVREVAKRVEPKQINLIVDDKVKAKLSREGYNPIFGARPLRRLVTKYVEDLISENLLKTPMTSKTRTIKIQLNEDDEIVVKN